MDFLVGIWVGMILLYVYQNRKKPSGTFVIDVSDPNKDVCRLELDESLDSIWSKKQIILKIKTYGDDSSK